MSTQIKSREWHIYVQGPDRSEPVFMTATADPKFAERYKRQGLKVEEAPAGSWRDKPFTHAGRIRHALDHG
jgi:hypothetical protein